MDFSSYHLPAVFFIVPQDVDFVEWESIDVRTIAAYNGTEY